MWGQNELHSMSDFVLEYSDFVCFLLLVIISTWSVFARAAKLIGVSKAWETLKRYWFSLFVLWVGFEVFLYITWTCVYKLFTYLSDPIRGLFFLSMVFGLLTFWALWLFFDGISTGGYFSLGEEVSAGSSTAKSGKGKGKVLKGGVVEGDLALGGEVTEGLSDDAGDDKTKKVNKEGTDSPKKVKKETKDKPKKVKKEVTGEPEEVEKKVMNKAKKVKKETADEPEKVKKEAGDKPKKVKKEPADKPKKVKKSATDEPEKVSKEAVSKPKKAKMESVGKPKKVKKEAMNKPEKVKVSGGATDKLESDGSDKGNKLQ
uniref:M-ORF n=1 Tax=Echyridella menziesii TaxID=981778 RepID=A0A1B2TRZ4_9BIVA|nr:MORF [Echyridella menziesii]AQT38549.1 M-ORF [Echyridella menziesii]